MKKLIILTAVFSLLFFSCDWLFDDSGTEFWAQNLKDGSSYKVGVELLVSGKYCEVWAEKESGVSKETAQNVANTYDNNIYPKMISNFSERNFTFLGYDFSNILELADELTDGNGKLTILLLDIKDNYEKGVNDSYVEGYFWAGNLFSNNQIDYSNERDMIYVDTNPGKPGSPESNGTLAHELQHLMNFTTTLVNRSETNAQGQLTDIFPMDTWIDEGLAAAAEWVISGQYDEGKINWFKNNGAYNSKGEKVMSGSIDKGNNFFVWGNRDKENQYAALDDYATVYLFFQWLRLEGTSDIYKKIITSTYSDYEAVVSNINGYSSWASLLEIWLAANRINSQNGQFGYKGAFTVNVTYAPTSPKSVQLYPGEAVYSLANTNPNVTASGNIVYKYITANNISASHSANTTLLTYNKNTLVSASGENGTVTGVAPAASVSAIADGSRAVSAAFSLPYRIDAGDLLRRSGANQNLPFGKLSLLEKAIEKKAELDYDE